MIIKGRLNIVFIKISKLYKIIHLMVVLQKLYASYNIFLTIKAINYYYLLHAL